MIWLRRIFEFYLDSSIHVALALVSFLELTSLFLNISVSNELRLFVLFGSIACYNFLKYGIEVHKYSIKGNRQKRIIGVLSLISAFIAFYYILSFKTQVLSVLGILMILVLLYAFPIYPHQKSLRSLGIVKVLLVAIVWSGITAFVPVVSSLVELNWDAYVVTLQRFITVIVLMIPFEIRDMHLDPPAIRTLPRRIGIRRTKLLGVILTVLTYLMIYLRDEVSYNEIIGRAVFAVVLCILILKTPQKPSKYYASFWVEALPIFWLGFVSLLQVPN